MRAAVVIHTPRVSTSAIVVGYESLARTLAMRGHALEILGPADIGAGGISARLYPLVLPWFVRRWLHRRPDLDVLVFHSYVGWLCRADHARHSIVSFHGFEPLFYEAQAAEAGRSGAALSWRYRFTYGHVVPRMLMRACRRVALVTCLNSREHAALIDRGYAPAERVWQHTFGMPAHYEGEHEYRARATVLIAVMQWLPTKGTRYLVAAFAALARRHADLRLRVAGTLREEEAVRRDFPADVRERVDVVPCFARVDQHTLFRHADIFVHTSVYEGIGLAILEALSSGIPVVTTRTGVAIDALEDGRDGAIVPVADAEALVAAVEGLLDDRDRRRDLGRSGRSRVASMTEAVATAELADRLEQIARRPACG